MQCPVDQETLVMTERQGVEIDYCPKCRGVWLDRGELDKIVERSASIATVTPANHLDNVVPPTDYRPVERHEYQQPHEREYRREHHEQHGEENYYRGRDGHDPRKKKREGFLGDLFDF